MEEEESTIKKHYVCSGDCGSVSQKPAVCTVEGCTRIDVDMDECTCEDGMHGLIRAKSKPQEIEL